MHIEDFIIWTYCFVVDFMNKDIPNSRALRTRGFDPKISDAEIITIEIVGEYLQMDEDTAIWRYFKHHWLSLFPNLGSRSNFAKQAAGLWNIKQRLHSHLVEVLGAHKEKIHIIDGFPMKTCHFKRAYFSKTFKHVEQSDYGFCASKSESYFGFEGTVVISESGVITGFTVTKPNIEREASFEAVYNINGCLFTDKGYLGEKYAIEMEYEQNITIIAPPKSNQKDNLSKKERKHINDVRRKIESVISQLTERYSIGKVKAREVMQLTNRITRKVLSHTFAMIAIRDMGRSDMSIRYALNF